MKRHIWIWNHYATDMFRDQGGRHYWFAEKLNKKGYNVTIFCASTIHNSKDNIDTEGRKFIKHTINGISFVFVKTSAYKGNRISRIKNMIDFYRNLFPVSKEYSRLNGKPDIILASSVHPLTLVAGIKNAKRFGINCICEIRDLWPEAIFTFNKIKEKSILGKILISGEHGIYKNADFLIFTKEGDTDYIKEKKWNKENGGDINLNKCHYINNGVDLESFENLINTAQIDEEDLYNNKFKVIYAGAIRPVNDLSILIGAAKLLKQEDILFLIYGDGTQLEEYRNKVKEEGLENVKLKGFVSKKHIPFILSYSSVNILNYSQDKYNWKRGNSSNKLFEYMASGKPVISTVKMGYCIITKYNCGLTLEQSTPQALAEAIMNIKNLLPEEYKKLCDNAKNGVKEFDFNKLTERLIDIIDGA